MTFTPSALDAALDAFEESKTWEYTRSDGTHRSGVTEHQGFYGLLEAYLDNREEGRAYELAGFGTLKIVADERYGEGGGDYAAVVFSVTAKDGTVRLFRKEGYYASYDGYTWDGTLSEVRPAQKTITVFERV